MNTQYKHDSCPKCGGFKDKKYTVCFSCSGKKSDKPVKGCDKHTVKNLYCMDCIRKWRTA